MKRLVVLIALLLCAWDACAASGSRHFLWRASKGPATIYLAGSVHVLRPQDYPLPAILESTFKDSAGLVEEIDLSHFDAESAQLQMMQIGAYPQGQSLQTGLPAALYQRVTALAQRQKVDMAMIEPMRPWLASIVLLDNELVQRGYDPASGVDIHFSEEADADNKPVIGLEVAAFQFGLLANLPDAVQQDMLVQTLDDTATLDRDMQKMMTAWRTGDTAIMEQELQQEFGAYPQVYQSIIVQRNRSWVPRLENLAASGKRYFVVVGALHLIGPDGVLALLKKDGYTIDQM